MRNNEKAFTLVEVIASIVIITIVLLSIAALVLQSNFVAHSNNEKLVSISLANTTLEHLKTNRHVVKTAIETSTDPTADHIEIPLFQLDLDDLSIININGNPLAVAHLNDQYYQVNAYKTTSPESASKLNLVNVLVEVRHVRIESSPDGNPLSITDLKEASQIEGYVHL